ncbi:MAG: DnaD domain protein [Streptococcaceae bacterium]|jgi:replication initiation and membrane attachment protein|nr:DnaD domain protein [Streptococcaceae bacterium]
MPQITPNPREFYKVEAAGMISFDSLLSLSRLYLPIIGSDAFALYMALFGQSSSTKNSKTTAHNVLFDMVGMSGVRFCKAKNQLEGMTLLQTFKQDSFDFGTEYLYRLNAPFLSQLFFTEPLFSGLLLAKIGQSAFDKLVKDYEKVATEVKSMKNISKKFTEVYTFDLNILNEEDERLNQTKKKIENKTDDNFDIKFFKEMMKKQSLFFHSEKQDILQLLAIHALFGLNELEIFNKALNLARADNVLNITQLKQILENRTTKLVDLPVEQRQELATTLQDMGFSKAEAKIIEEAESLAPNDYLENIRLQKGGFVAPSERCLLSELRNNELNTGVINILINYVLVIQDNPTLSYNYVMKIANDWVQNTIVDAASAIMHIKTIVANSKMAKPKRQSKRKTSQKVEKIPDFIKQKNKQEVSTEELKKLERELADISSFNN